MNVVLWIIQVLLAVVFVFAGGMKLIASPEQFQQGPVQFPTLFIRFIGLAEFAGGLGLVLPGLFRIKPELTPLAALGLLIIMGGAVTVTWRSGQYGPAIFSAIIGLLLALVAYMRWRRLPHASRSLQQASAM